MTSPRAVTQLMPAYKISWRWSWPILNSIGAYPSFYFSISSPQQISYHLFSWYPFEIVWKGTLLEETGNSEEKHNLILLEEFVLNVLSQPRAAVWNNRTREKIGGKLQISEVGMPCINCFTISENWTNQVYCNNVERFDSFPAVTHKDFFMVQCLL